MNQSTVPALAQSEFRPPLPGYEISWFDEFDGSGLDEAKWAHRSLGPRRDAMNTKDAVSLDGDGHLLIETSRHEIPEGIEYRTGMIGTQGLYETTYGYFECRMRVQQQPGHWSAFWLQTPAMGSVIGDPAGIGVEIDVIEYRLSSPGTAQHTIHWDGYGEDHESAHEQVSMPTIGTGFHVFACQWTPQELVFFVDGQETWRTRVAVPQRDQYMILSLEVGKWGGDIAQAELPDGILVDWVRVWKKRPGPDESKLRAPLRQAMRSMENGRADRAIRRIESWLESDHGAPTEIVALATLLLGQARVADGQIYESFFAFEGVITTYPRVDTYQTAVEEELAVAIRTLQRIKDEAEIDARLTPVILEELLIRVSERVPGTGVAEHAAAILVDLAVETGSLAMVRDAAEIYLIEHPDGPHAARCRELMSDPPP